MWLTSLRESISVAWYHPHVCEFDMMALSEWNWLCLQEYADGEYAPELTREPQKEDTALCCEKRSYYDSVLVCVTHYHVVNL